MGKSSHAREFGARQAGVRPAEALGAAAEDGPGTGHAGPHRAGFGRGAQRCTSGREAVRQPAHGKQVEAALPGARVRRAVPRMVSDGDVERVIVATLEQTPRDATH